MDRRPSQPQVKRRILDLRACKWVRINEEISQPQENILALPKSKQKYRIGTHDDISELLKVHEIHEEEGVFLENKIPHRDGILDVEFKGGFSKSVRVYVDPEGSSKSYACKEVISEKFNKNEIVHMCQLNDISICKLYGLVRKPNAYLILMEYCGSNLSDLIKTLPFSFDHIVDITKQLCMAVDFAHNNMILHLDIKPDNICLLFLFEKFVLKLIDWGSSVKTNSSTEVESFTLLYASPELLYRYLCQMLASCKLEGEMTIKAVELTQKFINNYDHIENVSTKSDSYSIGLTIMFAKTGTHLYGTVTDMYNLFKMFAEDPNAAINLFPDSSDFLTNIARRLVKGNSLKRASVKDIQREINVYEQNQYSNTEVTQCNNQSDATPDQNDQELNIPDFAKLL